MFSSFVKNPRQEVIVRTKNYRDSSFNQVDTSI